MTTDDESTAMTLLSAAVGTTIDTGADWDSAIVQLTALSPRVEDAFAALSEVLRHPSFPEEELERLRALPDAGARLSDAAALLDALVVGDFVEFLTIPGSLLID